jgi:2-keto-4-pentenoate hydratase
MAPTGAVAMITSLDLEDIAAQIRAAQVEVRQIGPITSRMRDFDLPSAYAVAHLIHKVRVSEGAIPIGRKIGFTNPDMWSIYGVREPI